MLGRTCCCAGCLKARNYTSASDPFSELVISSCWPGISASSAENVDGCSLAEFLDLGMLDH